MNKIKVFSVGNPREIKALKVSGSTLTVPNLAPTLIEIINSSINGDKIPLTSSPRYDENEEAGIARVMANNASIDAKFNFASEEQNVSEIKPKEHASEDTSEHASETESEG